MAPAFLRVIVLVFSLRVEDVGVLGTAVRDADEELIGFGGGGGD